MSTRPGPSLSRGRMRGVRESRIPWQRKPAENLRQAVLAKPLMQTSVARLRAQDRTSCTSVVIRSKSRCGLRTPPAIAARAPPWPWPSTPGGPPGRFGHIGCSDSAAPPGYARECSLAHAVLWRGSGIMAALGLRGHRWPPLDAISLSRVNHVWQDARRTRFFPSLPTPRHGSLGWYLISWLSLFTPHSPITDLIATATTRFCIGAR
jgi:hypothetical protein